jgi:hypothetical protein
MPKMKSWQETQDAINAAISRFPETFGLRAWPGDTFRISQGSSYLNDAGVPMLYTEVKRGNQWESFAKGTEQELQRTVVPLKAPDSGQPSKYASALHLAADADAPVVETPEPEPDPTPVEATDLDPRITDFAREHREELYTSDEDVPTRLRDLRTLVGPVGPRVFYVPELLSGSDFSEATVEVANYKGFMKEYEDQPGVYPVVGSHNSFAVAIRLNVMNDTMLQVFEALQEAAPDDEAAEASNTPEAQAFAWKAWVAGTFELFLIEKFPDFAATIEEFSDAHLKAMFEAIRKRTGVEWRGDTVEGATIDVPQIVEGAIPEDFKNAPEPEDEPKTLEETVNPEVEAEAEPAPDQTAEEAINPVTASARRREHHKAASFLRNGSNTGDLEKTLHRAVGALAERGIPSLVVGGYAVQENGYPRFTQDIDLVVPDVPEARSALSISGFKENAGSSMTVTDRVTRFEVDLLPGGGSVGKGPLPLPMPQEVTSQPKVVDLRTLIEIKLSSYIGNPGSRLQDAADVVALAKANTLPRDFALDEAVKPEYERLWDNLDLDKQAHVKWQNSQKKTAGKPKCPHCGSTEFGLMPTDFETAKCAKCGKNWELGIVDGINNPKEASATRDIEHEQISSSTDEQLAARKAQIEAHGRTYTVNGTSTYPPKELRELQRIESEMYNRKRGTPSEPWVTTVPPRTAAKKAAAVCGRCGDPITKDPYRANGKLLCSKTCFDYETGKVKEEASAKQAAVSMDEFTKAYFECALWSSMDEADPNTGGDPLDKNYSLEDFDEATRAKMITDCQEFQEANGALLVDENLTHAGQWDGLQLGGHDFWLTRNGHGSGFWDGAWQEPAAATLTAAAKKYGQYDLYVGDDGKIDGQ